MILTILSQATTDANRDRAWESLTTRYESWDSVRGAPRRDVEDAIRVGGLAGQKARTIQRTLDRLADERGRPDLEHLRDMSDDDAMRYLTRFDGVGVKTAACVLCFSLRRPVLPVDTHVLRIGRRIGWVPASCSAERAHRWIEERVRPEDRFSLHVLFIALGRGLCTARRPRCEECPLSEGCPRIGVS